MVVEQKHHPIVVKCRGAGNLEAKVERLEDRQLLSAAFAAIPNPVDPAISGRSFGHESATPGSDVVDIVQKPPPLAQNSPGGLNLNSVSGELFSGILGSAETGIGFTPSSYSIDWGDGTFDRGATIIRNGDKIEVSGEHAYAVPGTYHVQVLAWQVFGAGMGAPNRSVSVIDSTMTVAPQPPGAIAAVALPLGPIMAGEVTSQSLALLTHLPIADASVPHTAFIDWGDRSEAQNSPPTTNLIATASHTYARAGTYTLTLSYFQGSTAVATMIEPVQVLANAPGGMNLTAATGKAFAGEIGTFNDDQPFKTTAIFWGDGTFSMDNLVSLSGSTYQVSGFHIYANPGTYRVRVLTYDDAGPCAPVATTVSPIQVPGAVPPDPGTPVLDSTMVVSGPVAPLPTPTGQAVGDDSLVAPADYFSGTLAELTSASLPPGDCAPEAFADFGDGSGPGLIDVAEQDGKWVASGAHLFEAEDNGRITTVQGAFDVTVAFKTHDHVNAQDETVIATVHETMDVQPNTPGGLTVTATAGRPFSGVIGTLAIDPRRPFQFATIGWGDIAGAPVTTAVLSPLGNNQYLVSGSYTYSQAGRYRVTVQAHYNDNFAAMGSDVISTVVVAGSSDGSSGATPGAPLTTQSGSVMKAVPFSLSSITVGQLDSQPLVRIMGTTKASATTQGVVRWGDGKATNFTAASLKSTPDGMVLSAGHPYRHRGRFTIKVLLRRGRKLIARLRESILVRA